MTIRVLLVDDHEMMRQGLRSIIEDEPDIELVAEASSGLAAVELTAEHRPDVVILDIAMPGLNGIDAMRQIRERRLDARLVALSSHSERRFVLGALRAGADAYVLKSGAYEDLRRAVRAVHAGKRYLCPEVAGVVVDASLSPGAPGVGSAGPVEAATPASAFELLAPREREVLQLVAEGLTSAQIAGRLHLAPSTIDTHRRNLMRKLGLHNVADITRYAIRQGLVSLDPGSESS